MPRRIPLLSFTLAAAVGCGAHLHRPKDAATAEGAQTDLKAARLVEGFAEELAQSRAMLAEEIEAAREWAETSRNRDLLDILAAVDEADPEIQDLFPVGCRGRFKGDGWTTLCGKIYRRLSALTGMPLPLDESPAPSAARPRRPGEPAPPPASDRGAELLRELRALQRHWKGPNSGESQLGRAADEYTLVARAQRLRSAVAPPPRCPTFEIQGLAPVLQTSHERLRALCLGRRDNLRALAEKAVCRGAGCGASELGAQIARLLAVHDALALTRDDLTRRLFAYEVAKRPCNAAPAAPPNVPPSAGPPGQPGVSPSAGAAGQPGVSPSAGPPGQPWVPPGTGSAGRAGASPSAGPPGQPWVPPAAGPAGQAGASPSAGSTGRSGPPPAATPAGRSAGIVQAPFALSPGAGLIGHGLLALAPGAGSGRRPEFTPIAPGACDEAALRDRFAALDTIPIPPILVQHDLVPLGRLGRLHQLDEQLGAVDALIEERQARATARRRGDSDAPAVDEALREAPPFARVLHTTIEGIDRVADVVDALELGILALIRETLRVERDALAEAQAHAERRLRIDRAKLAGQLEETVLLLEASGELARLERAGCAAQALVAAHEAPKCRDDLTRALIAFGNAWTLGRAAQKQADVLDLGARHDASIARSRAAMALREVHLVAGVAELVKFNKGGLAPEVLAQLIVSTVGFAVLAGGVYGP